jgi:hypothetical protein
MNKEILKKLDMLISKSYIRVIGVDPGTYKSGLVSLIFDRPHKEIRKVEWVKEYPNDSLVPLLKDQSDAIVVIEYPRSYNMRVGDDMFDMICSCGRMLEGMRSSNVPAILIPRTVVKHALCGNVSSSDAQAKEAARHKYVQHEHFQEFGKLGKGTRKNPGIFYGFNNHTFDALAVIVTFMDALISDFSGVRDKIIIDDFFPNCFKTFYDFLEAMENDTRLKK